MTRPEIIGRSEWGAIVTNLSSVASAMQQGREGIVAHHMPERATLMDTPKADEIRRMRVVDDFHRNTRKWVGGFGYSWAIANSGRIYEGRGFRVGAHTGAQNSRFFGVGFFADGRTSGITEAARKSFWDLAAWLQGEKWLAPEWRVRYHSDFMSTVCPGDRLKMQLAAGPPLPVRVVLPGTRVWSDWFKEVLIVTEYLGDNNWKFIRESDLRKLGARADSLFSAMPNDRKG